MLTMDCLKSEKSKLLKTVLQELNSLNRINNFTENIVFPLNIYSSIRKINVSNKVYYYSKQISDKRYQIVDML